MIKIRGLVFIIICLICGAALCYFGFDLCCNYKAMTDAQVDLGIMKFLGIFCGSIFIMVMSCVYLFDI